jgi:hypothetical protein
MKRFTVRVAALVCVVSAATLTAVATAPVRRLVQTLDRNGDGRPDVWRHFDARGQVTEIQVDSNFDGKPDIEEFYEQGALVRRESDRNFNGQADLIEEFDAETHGQTRSVVDVDFDGTADLLVLFQDGRPVYSERAPSKPAALERVVRSSQGGSLAPLADPFESDPAVRTARVAPAVDLCVALSNSSGPAPIRFDLVDPLSRSAVPAALGVSFRRPALLAARSPRAPPLA